MAKTSEEILRAAGVGVTGSANNGQRSEASDEILRSAGVNTSARVEEINDMASYRSYYNKQYGDPKSIGLTGHALTMATLPGVRSDGKTLNTIGTQRLLRDTLAGGGSFDDWYKQLQQQAEDARAASSAAKGAFEKATAYQGGVWDMEGNYLGDGPMISPEERTRLQNQWTEAERSALWAQQMAEMAGGMRYTDLNNAKDFAQGAASGLASFERDAAELNAQQEAARQADYEKYMAAGTGGMAYEQNLVQSLRDDTTWREPREDWSQQERDTFGYLYNRDKDEAYAYAQQLNNQKNAAIALGKQREAEAWATKNFGTGALATGLSLVGQAFSGADFLDDMVEYAARGTVTQDAQLSAADYGSIMTGAITETLNGRDSWANNMLSKLEPVFGEIGLGDLYQVGYSVLQNLSYAKFFGGIGGKAFSSIGGGATYFGIGAKGGYEEAVLRGASPGRALVTGLASGLIEGLTEYFSVEKLMSIKSPSGPAGLMKAMLQQGFVEGNEELASQFGTTLADIAINGDKSAYYTNLNNYLMNGMSQEEASRAAFSDWAKETAWSFASGFASGGLSGFVQGGGEMIKAYKGDSGALIAEGLASEDSKTRELAEKYSALAAEGRNGLGSRIRAGAQNAGQAVQKAGSTIREKAFMPSAQFESAQGLERQSRSGSTAAAQNAAESAQKGSEATQDKGKGKDFRLRGYEAARLQEALNEQNRPRIKDLVTSRLQEAGADAAAFNMADTVTKVLMGEDINAIEEARLKRSKGAMSVLKSLADGSKQAIGRGTAAGRVLESYDSDNFYNALMEAEKSLPEEWRIFTNSNEQRKAAAEKEQLKKSGYGSYIRGVLKDGATAEEAVEIADNAEARAMWEQMSGKTLPADAEAAAQMIMDTRAENVKIPERIATPSAELRNDREAASPKAEDTKPETKPGSKGEGRRAHKGKVHYKVDRKSLSKRQKESAKVLEIVSRALGVDIYIEPYGLSSNGWYDPKDGSIHIAADAGQNREGTLLFTAAHELTHFMQQWSEAKYKVLADFLFEQEGISPETLEQLKAGQIARAKADGRKLSDREAYDEVVADCMERMLTDENVVQKLNELRKADERVFNKVKEYLSRLFKRVEELYRGLEPNSEEAKLVARMGGDTIKRLQELFTEGLTDAGENYRAAGETKNTTDDGGVRYSFAGVRAKTANRHNLANAQAMLNNGVDAEQVRKETGWLKGYDNRWRFEIDDSEAKLKTSAFPKSTTLENILEHKELYEAYPELKEIQVIFADNPEVTGSYDRLEGEITLASKLKNDVENLKRSLLHEVQHAVQDIEKFARGASIEYWDRQIKTGYDTRPQKVQKEERQLKEEYEKLKTEEPGFFSDMMALQKLHPTVPRGKVDFNTFTQIEEDPPEWKKYDKRRAELKNKYGKEKLLAFDDLIWKIEQIAKKGQRNALELYYDTAGEIEARNVSGRANMTKEERKNTRPFIDKSDVVFADNTGIALLKSKEKVTDWDIDWDPDNHSSLKSQLVAHQKELDSMEPVTSIKYMKNGASYGVQLAEILRTKFGNKISRVDGATFLFDSDAIASLRRYVNSDEEAAAVLSSPYVLKRGKAISGHKNHKDKGYPSVTYAGPVIINGTRTNVAVAVLFADKDRPHSLRVLLPNGKEFVIKKETGSKRADVSPKKGGTRSPTEPVKENISQSRPDVKHQSRNTAAVERANRSLERQNAKLKEDIKELKKLLKLQKSVSKGSLFNPNSVDAAAKALMKSVNAKGDRAELREELKRLYKYIATEKELSWEGVRNQASGAAAWLMQHMDREEQLDPYAEEVLRELKGLRVSLNEGQLRNGAYAYGGVREFRNAAMGKFIISKQAMPLDSAWAELSASYPNLFDPEISDADQGTELIKVFERLRGMTLENEIDHYDSELLERELIRQVYDSYWDISTMQTVADTKQEEINQLKTKHRRQMAELKAENEREIAKLKAEFKKEAEQIRKDEEKKYTQKRLELLQQVEAARQRNAASREKTNLRRMIRRVNSQLKNTLEKATRQRNVKEGMQEFVRAANDYNDAIFADDLSAEDMIRTGFTVQVGARDEVHIKAARELLRELDAVTPGSDRERRLRSRLNYRIEKLDDLILRERGAMYNEDVKSVLGRLLESYKELQNAEEDYIRTSYSPELAMHIEGIMGRIGGQKAMDMSVEALRDVYDAFTAIHKAVTNANKAFTDGRSSISEDGAKGANELERATKDKGKTETLLRKILKAGWGNIKPVQAFKIFGSETLEKYFKKVLRAEGVWARDIAEGHSYARELMNRYGYDKWDMEKLHSFSSTNGEKFELTVPQMMSLYALSRRGESALEHLREGGFVFDPNSTRSVKGKLGIKQELKLDDATAYNLDIDELAKISAALTQQQRDYVDGMVKYLSTTMGEKGNEVSMAMYGIKLFKEERYFPLRVASQYMERIREAGVNERKIKNSGFTQPLTPKAGNPVVLSDFTDVWSEHLNDMSLYHAMVLPLEDFYRVYNYKSRSQEGSAMVSVNAAIQNGFGKAAADYVDQLLRDINGGAVRDPRANLTTALVSKFKKASTFASASVWIQQPSSVGRAFAVISPKYFTGRKMSEKQHHARWEEIKKYAPVAIIKEMGGFDANMGQSVRDYIKQKEYKTLGERSKAIITDEQYRDEILSRMPALADELTWCYIWDAVKRETADKRRELKVGSEEFLQAVGERFTDIIQETQVYDSVLARSANMRSKDTGMTMVTAFMAEPLTTVNMMTNALLRAARGDRVGARREVGAVLTSIVMNAALVSIVYAMRDDDEYESFLEKYLASFTVEISDGVNPFTYFPVIRDIWSAAQGYDIERSDMSIITDLMDSLNSTSKLLYQDVENMSEEQREEWLKKLKDALWKDADYATALIGVPVKNIRRDIMAVGNMIELISADYGSSAESVRDAVSEGWLSSIPFFGQKPKDTKQDKLYEAMLMGDEVYTERLLSAYSDETAAHTAIRKALRENEARITEAAAARLEGDVSEYIRIYEELMGEGRFERDDIIKAIESEMNAMSDSDSESSAKRPDLIKAKDYYRAVLEGNADSIEQAYRTFVEQEAAKGKLEDDAASSLESSVSSNVRNAYLEGEMDRDLAFRLLTAYAGKNEEDAEGYLDKLDFQMEHGYSWDEREEAFRLGEITEEELKQGYMDVKGMNEEEAGRMAEYVGLISSEPEFQGLSETQYQGFYRPPDGWNVSPADIGIDLRTYARYRLAVAGIRGTDKKEQILAYIDTLPLTPEQKDLLYYQQGYSSKNLKNAPWH